MKKFILPILVFALLFSCNKEAKSSDARENNKKFEQYKDNFITSYWEFYPDYAASQGYHKLDSLLIIPDSKYNSKLVDFANANLDSLKNYDLDNLSDNNKTDFYMIKNQRTKII
jgi:hypothetical protein